MFAADAPRELEALSRTIELHSTLLRTWTPAGGVSAQVTALELETADGRTEKLVVRRHGAADLQRNPNLAADEFRLLHLLHGAGLPVPAPRCLAAPFLVVDFVEGEPGPAVAHEPSFVTRFAAALAQIHRFDCSAADVVVSPGTCACAEEPAGAAARRLLAGQHPVAGRPARGRPRLGGRRQRRPARGRRERAARAAVAARRRRHGGVHASLRVGAAGRRPGRPAALGSLGGPAAGRPHRPGGDSTRRRKRRCVQDTRPSWLRRRKCLRARAADDASGRPTPRRAARASASCGTCQRSRSSGSGAPEARHEPQAHHPELAVNSAGVCDGGARRRS